MWDPGDIIAWRGIYRERVWHAIPTTVVKDSEDETVLSLTPGAVCMVEETYPKGKNMGRRRWDFIEQNWTLAPFTWHTNRVLILLQPYKYYGLFYFWNDASNQFIGCYVNFQLPFRKNERSLDALDLDLDLVIHPDHSFQWKDIDDYKKGIETGIILPDWAVEIEHAKAEILAKLEERTYPFDFSWQNWCPDPDRAAITLPPDWDKVH